jgi:transcriptional regulator with XRE-family HTH domain
MSDPDPKTTLREFSEYFAGSYAANHKIARQIGVRVKTLADWLSGYREPTGKSLSKLRAFLDAEARRATGDGIRPIERVPYKIIQAGQAGALRSALRILPKSAGQDRVIQPKALPRHLPEVRSDRPEARQSSSRAQGVEWAGYFMKRRSLRRRMPLLFLVP